MIKIYNAQITDFTQADYTKAYSLLDCALKEKICAKKCVQDKMCSIAGYILLWRGALEIYGKTDFNINFNKNGKPLVDFCYFNISHSEDRVVCAFSDRPVGIVIQKIKPIIKRKKYKFFTDFESAYVNADEKLVAQRYTEIFTKKESALKMLGFSLADCGKIDTFSKKLGFEIQTKDDFITTVCWQNNSKL